MCNLPDSLPAAEGKWNDWLAIFNVSCVLAQILGNKYVAQWGQLSPREKTGGKRGGEQRVFGHQKGEVAELVAN